MSDWITSNICGGIYCHKLDVIMKCHFPLADVWFYIAESACFRCKVVHLQDENVKKCIRMGINVIKIVILGGKLSFLWLQIAFYISANASSPSSSDFLLTCRYRGNIHNSGPPSRQLACCMHGRSHTRSPGVSIMGGRLLGASTLCDPSPTNSVACQSILGSMFLSYALNITTIKRISDHK